jgi:Ras-related protein Rab-4B
VILVGNKLDREEDREVEYAEGSRWAQENGETTRRAKLIAGLLFTEVSSLSGENIITPFLLSARTILSSIDAGTLDPNEAGTGVSYGERQLRAVGSSSRLSGFGKRKRRNSVTLGDMVGTGKGCKC